jgi:hypothetical protein
MVGPLKAVAEWMLFSDIDLRPFYALIVKRPALCAIAQRWYGLKPMRPASLFEMAESQA